MRLKSISVMLEAPARFLKQWSERRFQPPNVYRLVEIKQSPSGYCKLSVQVIGKAKILEYSPQELIANDRILEGFSKKDIRSIAYLACEQSKRPRYQIVMQEFCNKFNRMLFKLKKQDSNETISKTAGQISLDKHLINNLSQEDVCSISYVAGYEQSYLEQEE